MCKVIHVDKAGIHKTMFKGTYSQCEDYIDNIPDETFNDVLNHYYFIEEQKRLTKDDSTSSFVNRFDWVT